MLSLIHRRFASAEHLGLVTRQFGKIAISTEEKHAAVPQIVSGRNVLLCGSRIRLFDEFGQLVKAL